MEQNQAEGMDNGLAYLQLEKVVLISLRCPIKLDISVTIH